MTLDTLKILIPTVTSFILGMALTPFLTDLMYKHKMWRKISRSKENDVVMSANFKKIHNHNGELNTPRVGGLIIWISVILITCLFFILSIAFPESIFQKLNFFSRNQTLLPLAALLGASIVGLIDDLFQIYGHMTPFRDGLTRRLRILIVILIASVSVWWFVLKLGVTEIYVPFFGLLDIGIWFIPFFILVVLGVFSGSIIDGIDGLAGGVMASAYGALMIIAILQNQLDIAALCGAILGSLLVFTWFNIPPARFYIGETGMLGLTITFSLIAFLADQPLLIPIIAFPLLATSLSSTIQIFSKKYFNKKIFLVAPLHHHFEALGWPSYKVTMRYWVISIICAFLGIVLFLLG